MNRLMRVQVEAVDNLGTTPRGFYWGERRIGIVEMIDQWYRPDYRYVKAKADLIMFVSAQGQAPATQAA